MGLQGKFYDRGICQPRFLCVVNTHQNIQQEQTKAELNACVDCMLKMML